LVQDCCSSPSASIGAIALTMFVSELGDKTQMATLSLSSLNPSDRVAVWTGATVGMVGADAVAIYVGLRLHRAIPQRVLVRAAAALFIAFGVAAIAFSLW
jgi:putative Ca2+/H+ antiporter (TMEM165/GDT1 family)